MKQYVLLINKNDLSESDFITLLENLKTSFRSYEYMMGFLDGYCFDKYLTRTLNDFENAFNRETITNKTHWIKFLTVEETEK